MKHLKRLNLITYGVTYGVTIWAAMGCMGKKTSLPEPKPEVTNPYEKIAKLNWILGSWENATDDGILTETWTKQNDSVFAGSSILMAGKDTQFVETISIEQRGAEVYYIPIIKDQNNGQPTLFKLSASNTQKTEGHLAVFENPAHDFPQNITYQLSGDSLVAKISGKFEGKEMSERFPMVRVVPLIAPADK